MGSKSSNPHLNNYFRADVAKKLWGKMKIKILLIYWFTIKASQYNTVYPFFIMESSAIFQPIKLYCNYVHTSKHYGEIKTGKAGIEKKYPITGMVLMQGARLTKIATLIHAEMRCFSESSLEYSVSASLSISVQMPAT